MEMQPPNVAPNALHKATINGDVDKVEQLLTTCTCGKGASCTCIADCVTAKDGNGFTALHYAVKHAAMSSDKDSNYLKILKKLLDKGANCKETTDGDEYTPLHLAALETGENCKDTMTALVERFLHDIDREPSRDKLVRAAINAQSRDGSTALHLACFKSNDAAVKFLLRRDDVQADLCTTSGKDTALHVAARTNNDDIVNQLLERKITDGKGDVDIDAENEDGYTPLLLAAKFKNYRVFVALWKQGAACDAEDAKKKNALHLAIEAECSEIAQYCICERPEYLPATPADAAADADGNTPIHLAAANGFVPFLDDCGEEMYKPYLDQINNERRTPLHLAAEHGHIKFVEKVCRLTPLSMRDESANTPMHLAAKNGHTDVVGVLKLRDNPVARNKEDQTPLHCAASGGHNELVKMLLEELREPPRHVDTKDNQKRMPLHLAAANGHLDVVQTLLEKGAGHCAKTTGGENALDLAIDNGHTDTAEALLAGLDSQSQDTKGKVLENMTTCAFTKTPTTTLRKLIDKMPHLVFKVFKLYTDCTPRDDIMKASPKYEETYHYNLFKNNHSYSKSKHPLRMMVEGSNWMEVFDHPFIANLMAFKWKRALYLYLVNVVFYIVFLCVLTAFVLLLPNPLSETCMSIANGTFDSASDTEGCAGGNLSGSVCGKCGLTTPQLAYRYFFVAFLLLFSVVRLVLEAFQGFRNKWDYFVGHGSYENYIEIALYLCCLAFLVTVPVLNSCLCPTSWQWQLGAVTVFLAWIEFGVFIRKLPHIGIYLIMFVYIVKTFAIIAIPALLLVVAFSISFYMVFFIPTASFAASPFASPALTIVKTMVMGVGEMDFETIFRLTSGGVTPPEIPPESIPYPWVSYLLWVLFLILMPILLMNLLTSVAVGDVSDIRDTAKRRILALQVDLIISTEEFPCCKTCLKRWLNPKKKELTVQPNQKVSRFQKWFKHVVFDQNESGVFDAGNQPSNDIQQLEKKMSQLETKLMAEQAKLIAEQAKLRKIVMHIARKVDPSYNPDDP